MHIVTVAAAAETLGVCQRTIRRLITDGELPAYRIGRAIRIRTSDLNAVLRPIPGGGAHHQGDAA